ncbi:MAG: putative membrane protein [Bacteroidetes bacterium HLUCCA01]|nr:MAG: putative membrane protein [Bacteroidetes bacterium HLUCCA01]
MNFKSSLFWTTLAISAFICVAALGPALFNANLSWGEWYASWQRQAFSGLCHQQTDRMFLLNGMPMAVCSRCLGIYSAFFAGIVLLPFLPQHRLRSSLIIPLLFASVVLNIVDVLTYALSVWDNTLFSRYAAGSLPGLMTAILLGTKNPQRPFNHLHYGNSK